MNALAPSFGRREYAPRANRTVTILIVAKLVSERGESLCRIRNISSGGLMLESRAPLAKGDPIGVELRSGRRLSGRVVWSRDGRAGVQFDGSVVVEEIVALPSAEKPSRLRRARQPRPPRIAAEARVEVTTAAGRVYARMIDISQGGARLLLPFRVQPGERMTLAVPGLPAKLAHARWAGEEVGVAFAEPLSFDALTEWLAERGG